MLVNYDGQNLGEFRRNLAAYGAVKVRSDAGAPGGDVRTLSLEVNGENYRAVLELLKRALVENARGYDARDLRAAGTPNEMNLRSVFSDMDLDANRMEAEFQASFQELLYFFNPGLEGGGPGRFHRPAGGAHLQPGHHCERVPGDSGCEKFPGASLAGNPRGPAPLGEGRFRRAGPPGGFRAVNGGCGGISRLAIIFV